MSNGDDEPGDELSPDSLTARLDEAVEALDEAESEPELDEVEAMIDEIAADLEAADLPEPDDEDEDGPAAELEERLADVRSELEDARGPYAADIVDILADAEATLSESEWTDDGSVEAVEAVGTFVTEAGDAVEISVEEVGDDPAAAAETLSTTAEDIEAANLDADDDADTIAVLLEAAGALADGLEAAEVWSDLTIREQLDAQGFYDILDPATKKDFPPEWNAIKLYATNGEAEPILTALEKYESDFMEENILAALERFAPAEAFDPLAEQAERRDKHAIRVLGRIGDDRAVDIIAEFLGGGDVELEVVVLRALGAIGSQDATQDVADRLVAENPEIRSTAARALGMIGDTRAVDPLADRLEEDDADTVRASAAWALRQIGTERALETAAEYADDRAYIVQAEAEKAAGV
ncbi:MAG: HEAT repeat domain-containing protein [Salinirussus sp.]